MYGTDCNTVTPCAPSWSQKVEHRAKRRIIPGNEGSNRNCNSMVGITFGFANEFLLKYLKLLTFTTLFIEVSIKIVFFSLEFRDGICCIAAACICNIALACVCISSIERRIRRE